MAEILIRGFAHIGIIALIDEATGYQYDRDHEALHLSNVRLRQDA